MSSAHLSQDLRKYIKTLDYLIVACTLNSSTEGLIDRGILSAMKKTAVLINVARGEIINEKFSYSLGVAFARFLEEKKCDKYKPILLAIDTRPSGDKLLISCLHGLKEKKFMALKLKRKSYCVLHQRLKKEVS